MGNERGRVGNERGRVQFSVRGNERGGNERGTGNGDA
jgi:hypothetical protein